MIISRHVRRSLVPGVITALAVLLNYSHAHAAYLRWASTAVKTSSLNTCFSFAHHTLSKKGYGSIHKTSSEVTGSKGGAYVAVTCIGTAPNATAMIMVMSDSDNSAVQARDEAGGDAGLPLEAADQIVQRLAFDFVFLLASLE